MKYVFLLLIGAVSVLTLPPLVALENINKEKATTSSIATPEEKAESVTEPVKDAKKSEPKPPKKVDVVKDNPKNCNQSTEWIYPDGSCHKKATDSIASSTTSKPSSGGGCELVSKYSNWDHNVAYAVCMAESGGNTNAANYDDNHGSCRGSFGLMQLACFWIDNPTNPTANMAKANEIYKSSGWSPWGAYTSGKYRQYLR